MLEFLQKLYTAPWWLKTAILRAGESEEMTTFLRVQLEKATHNSL